MGILWVAGVCQSRFAEDEEAAPGTLDSALVFAIRAEPGGGGHGFLVSN